MPSTLKSIPSCMTVHDNVAVAAIISEILSFQNFILNVCQCHKTRSRSFNVILMQRLD